MIGGIDKYFKSYQTQRSTIVNDDWGNPIQSWANNILVSGLIRQLNAKEVNVSDRDTPVFSHRLYCRVSDIKLQDRVLYGDLVLYVVRINDVMGFNELLQVDLYGNL